MAKCTRASVDEVLTRFQVGDKRFIEALGLRDGFVSVQGEVLVEMAEVIAAANAEIERLRAEVASLSVEARTIRPSEMYYWLVKETNRILQKDHPHA